MPAGVGYEPMPCRIASQAFTAPRPEIARPLGHGGRFEHVSWDADLGWPKEPSIRWGEHWSQLANTVE